MSDAAVGLARQLVHPVFDEEPGGFEPGRIEIGGDLDRRAPQKDAAAERQSEMEAVPAREHPASAGGKDDRDDRHAGEAGDVDDAAARLHRGPARPVWGNADAIPPDPPLHPLAPPPPPPPPPP